MKKPLLIITFIVTVAAVMAQTPGLIVRPAGGSGTTPLNPNGDGFSSSSTNGFVSNDVTESEIVYKIIPPVFLEPTSDLMRGREVYKTNNMLSAGNNNVQLSSLGVLSKGVYMLQLLHQNEVIFKQQIQKIR